MLVFDISMIDKSDSDKVSKDEVEESIKEACYFSQYCYSILRL